MPNYRPYPAYQPSGIDWLGNIPTGWCDAKIKYGYHVTLGKMLQPDAKSTKDELKPYLRAANIQPNGVDITDVRQMWFSFDDIKNLLLQKDDVLISEGGDVGRCAIWNNELDECYFQNAINRARALKDNSSRYLMYWMTMLKADGYIDILCNKSTIAHYTAEKVQATPILLPAFDEQQQIAAFLDRETAKIDQLIAKQQQLIELLKEKRQAVISHAVTKGLNPDVKMNPSGVEWLGNVPEHWTICALKHAWHIIDCKHLTAEFVDDGIPLASIREVQAWEVDLTNAKQTTPEFYAQLIEGNRKPEAGDIIYSRNATVGESAKVTEKHPVFSMGQDVCIFKRKSQSTNTDFFLYQIRSQSMQQQLDSLLIGSTFKRINVDNIRNFTVTVPPATEQQAISDFITQQLITFNQLLEKAQRQIELLRERRAALISAAVTGKIDVREVALLA